MEINLYVVGAGAFAVFLRWLEDQLAFNELGLADRSVFHALAVLFLAAAAFVFLRFLNRMREEGQYLPEAFGDALRNEGRLFRDIRWALGVLMCLGAVALFAASEVDKYVGLVRAVAILGLLTGVSYPLLLGAANTGSMRSWQQCLCGMLPVLLFAAWLLYSYRSNSINSVAWAYALDIFTPIAAMLAFFRMAGFAFGSANMRRSMFGAMFGAVMCMMALADERYMGMQLMLAAAAGMLVLYNWIMVCNLKQGKIRQKRRTEDGFERL
ncbi:MAG: hypothetical protein IJ594_01325 [Oscillospiraceae bacterium]|nr:hypothetical protein [Oscillospiraceae bacterium]